MEANINRITIIVLLFSLLLVVLSASIVSGQDDTSNPNNSDDVSKICSEWVPWDDGDEDVDLTPVLASDDPSFPVGSSALEESNEEARCSATALGGGSLVSFDDGLHMLFSGQADALRSNRKTESESSQTKKTTVVFVLMNGMNKGLFFETSGEGCLGTLASVAAEVLPTNRVDQMLPKMLYTNNGRPISTWEQVEASDRIIYLLTSQQTWVWPGVRVGFTWTTGSQRLTTVSLRPKVILIDDLFSAEEAEVVISSGKTSLFRSPEKHYSDDPKYQNYRTSATGNLNHNVQAVERIHHRSQQAARLPSAEYVESLQLLQYQPGQWYKEHYDLFHNVPGSTLAQEEAAEVESEALLDWAADMRHLMWTLTTKMRKTETETARRIRTSARILSHRPSSALYPDPRSLAFHRHFAPLLQSSSARTTAEPRFDGFGDVIKGTLPLDRILVAQDDAPIIDLHELWVKQVFCPSLISSWSKQDDDDDDDQNAGGDAVVENEEECLKAFEATMVDYQSNFGTKPPAKEVQRNRFLTILPYLNDVAEGGETVFPLSPGPGLFDGRTVQREGMKECSRGINVPPKAGSAALFYHQLPNGQPDKLSMHGGCPPVEGTKYAINVFCWNLNWKKGIQRVNEMIE